eukprot:TRINITY_DN18025_c0_g1_i1.p1 TRINITY_DN18025_c0_g1~~TRINITY_DN18025_c0_g1_i1.p1  ORF type:complete len:534 (+),score=166.27 TRINITY_DN18025_c0_g1_i1:52-1653(+)
MKPAALLFAALAPAAQGAWPTKQVCVADRSHPDAVGGGLSWACGEGGVDCTPINDGGALYYPNSIYAHGDYAFDTYYQAHSSGGAASCAFGGGAYLVNCIDAGETCRAQAGAGDDALAKNLASICSDDAFAARCDPIRPGGAHFFPNATRDHASWAMNLFYQTYRCAQPDTACDWGGTGEVVYPTTPPPTPAPTGAPLKCGVASAEFHACPTCLTALMKAGALDFWWNWGTAPKLDASSFTPAEAAAANGSFVPMLWDATKPADLSFLERSGYVMGFNEPDMYGPACDGSAQPAYGCSPGEYRAATSSGQSKALFDPQSAAGEWKALVNALTAYTPRTPHTVISPSMAMWATGDGSKCVGADPRKKDAPKICPGWLAEFKKSALKLDCIGFDGRATNCWDVLDVIQVHAYAHYPQAVTAKMDDYYNVFKEDFDGTNGRSRKTLWLTEVAMGSNNVTAITDFMGQLMSSTDGLGNRAKYPYVEKVSWFSNWAWDAFPLDGITPRPNEVWSSGLYQPLGSVSPLGEAFLKLCRGS